MFYLQWYKMFLGWRGTGGMVQAEEYLPSKHEALTSNTHYHPKKKKGFLN
jgi:hypothetical protein